MEKDDGSIKDKLDKLLDYNKTLIEQKKIKKFKIPWIGRLSRKNLKNNYITVLYIQDNKEAQFMKVPIDESTVMIKDKPHLVTPEDIMTYKGKPIVIIPSWNYKPFSPTENMDEALKDNTHTKGLELLLNRMKKQIILPTKGSFNWLLIVGVIAAVAAVGYLLSTMHLGLF